LLRHLRTPVAPPPGAEEFALIVRGEGIVLDGDNEIPVKVGDLVFHRKGSWHGFRNTSDTEEAEMLWGWGGASSKAEAGYELRYPSSPPVLGGK